jgi:hypothetical protein
MVPLAFSPFAWRDNMILSLHVPSSVARKSIVFFTVRYRDLSQGRNATWN